MGVVSTCAIAAVGLLSAGTRVARADILYNLSYSLQLDACNNGGAGGCAPDGSTPIISNLVVLNTDGAFQDSVSWEGALAISQDAEGPITVGFQFPGIFNPPIGSMLAALVNYLPSDGGSFPTDSHVVVFVDSSQAASLTGVSWDSLFNTSPGDFGNFSESAILNDLIDIYNESVDDSSANQDELIRFETYNRGLDFASDGGTFTGIAFSDGTSIGTGTSTLQTLGAVPEPGSLALLGFGLTGLMFAGVRKRKNAKRD